MTIAIDFGTSNTVVARWHPITQQPEVMKLPGLAWQFSETPPLIPSLLYVQDAGQNQVTIGQQVRDRGLDRVRDHRFFRNFKRGIGTAVQGFLPVIDEQTLSFEIIGQWFLTQVIEQIKQQEAIESLIFTVPVDSFEAYRHWLGQLSQTLDIPQIRLIDEPTAAALGYGLEGGETVLVMDFGGGTLDFSLVQLAGSPQTKPLGFILKWGQKSMAENSGQRLQTARVLAKAGENLGGSDLDAWIADYFANTQGMPVSALTLRLAEQLKIQLSTTPEACESFFDDETFETYELNLDRLQFEQLLSQQGFFERLDQRLGQVLQQANRQGIELPDIQAVLLVGGTAQIPAVQQWVKATFSAEKIRSAQPFTAIATGALQLQQGVNVQDFLYHSYGIRFWDRRQNCHSWHPIIPQGQAYPMSQPVTLELAASTENQPSIELIVGELGDAETSTEVYFENGRLVTRKPTGKPIVQPLNDHYGGRTLATLTPPGNPGCDRIRISFRVDEQRFLQITVEDLLTHEVLVQDQALVQLS